MGLGWAFGVYCYQEMTEQASLASRVFPHLVHLHRENSPLSLLDHLVTLTPTHSSPLRLQGFFPPGIPCLSFSSFSFTFIMWWFILIRWLGVTQLSNSIVEALNLVSKNLWTCSLSSNIQHSLKKAFLTVSEMLSRKQQPPREGLWGKERNKHFKRKGLEEKETTGIKKQTNKPIGLRKKHVFITYEDICKQVCKMKWKQTGKVSPWV